MFSINQARNRIYEVYYQNGINAVIVKSIAFLYRTFFRKVLPTVGHVCRNGVLTGEKVKLGDKYLPFSFVPISSHPEFSVSKYEIALSESVRRHVERGDKVVIIGGGA